MENTQEKLPNWDLSDLYKGMDDPKINKDLSKLALMAEKFETRYKGNLEALSGEEFAKAIKEEEKMSEIYARLGGFSHLLLVTDQTDPDKKLFESGIRDKLRGVSKKTLFWGLEINQLDDANINKKLENSDVAKYRPYIEGIREDREHDLPADIERLFVDKGQTSGSAWVKLYSEKMVRMRYEIDGEMVSEAVVDKLIDSSNEEDRAKGYRSLGKASEKDAWEFAMIMNNIAKDKAISDEWRKYKEPVSSRNLGNQVEDDVVENLVTTVKNNYKNLTHRYYGLKADWLGKDQLEYWDRNNEIPVEGLEEKKYSWEEAKNIVLESYGEFSPEMANIAKMFFDKNWIDAPPKDGKRSGAFSSRTVPDAHPYILMNFNGTPSDVKTLAHELGHGVHQYLSMEKQGMLMQGTPLTLSETASVFAEMLVFKNMLKKEEDPKKRFALITGKIQNMLNTGVRQIAFHDYETKVHNARKKGELSEEQFGNFWMDSMKESLGPKMNVDECMRSGWTQIPHMFRTPFYVYSYSFGNGLVNSLYKTYEEGKVEGFQDKYMELLGKGGSEKHGSMLKPFGLSAKEPDFWQKGLDVISDFIDEAEKIGKQLGLGRAKSANQSVKSSDANLAVINKKVSGGR